VEDEEEVFTHPPPFHIMLFVDETSLRSMCAPTREGKRVAATEQKLCARQTAARDCCRQQQELFVRRLSMSSWTKAARGSDREAVFSFSFVPLISVNLPWALFN